jgi:hypothetical protein
VDSHRRPRHSRDDAALVLHLLSLDFEILIRPADVAPCPALVSVVVLANGHVQRRRLAAGVRLVAVLTTITVLCVGAFITGRQDCFLDIWAESRAFIHPELVANSGQRFNTVLPSVQKHLPAFLLGLASPRGRIVASLLLISLCSRGHHACWEFDVPKRRSL